MKKGLYGLWLVLLMFLPLTTYAQVDTCYIPDLYGTGLFINRLIIADTAGRGLTGWQNNTRVYVLQKNGYYPYDGSIDVRRGRKLEIRAEDGNYAIPALGTADLMPQIYGYPVAGVPPGRFARLSQPNGIIKFKHLSICGIDESQAGTLDKNQGNMIEIQNTGNGSIYVDSCLLKTVSGQIMQIGASGAVHAGTIKVTNSVIADMGFIGNSNLGAGRGFDFRNSEVDSIIVENNTFVNWQDRVIRHYLSALPIHSFKFNHNTLVNGLSYCGTISLGLIDSLGNGPFEIKNNLFVDNCALGPDSDATRQGEFSDSPDRDPINNNFQISWIVCRTNPTAHITPWDISNNYYVISDSGAALRNLSSPYIHYPAQYLYPTEPIITSDMWRQLLASGGGIEDPFKKVSISVAKVPPLMTKMVRWYWSPLGDGTGGNTINNVGAGAGKLKDGTSNVPASHFIHDVANNVWVYDYNRRTAEWYMDSLDCSYASYDIIASSDGKAVGDPRWQFTQQVIQAPVFSLLKQSINFTTVTVGSTKKDSVLVNNPGNQPLQITAISSTNARFTFAPSTMTILPSESAILTVTFAPEDTSDQSGSIVFTHNASGSPGTLAVSGKGAAVVGIERDKTQIPIEFALQQNYPNPFNASTEIRFALPIASRVSLIIYDVVGREISALVDGNIEAGYYTARWNASSMAGGIYLAKFTAYDQMGNQKFSKVNKLLLVK
jgi:hypothetical protein